MTDTFVPVDLDKVLDEFEQTEECVTPAVGQIQATNNSLHISVPHNNVHATNCIGTDSYRLDNEKTVSFKDANKRFLSAFADEDVSRRVTVTENDVDRRGMPGVSLHDELLACNWNSLEDADSGSDTTSDTSSTSAIIAAAENITNQAGFDQTPPMQQTSNTEPQSVALIDTNQTNLVQPYRNSEVDPMEFTSEGSASMRSDEQSVNAVADQVAGSDFVRILRQVSSDGGDKPLGCSPLASYAGIWTESAAGDKGVKDDSTEKQEQADSDTEMQDLGESSWLKPDDTKCTTGEIYPAEKTGAIFDNSGSAATNADLIIQARRTNDNGEQDLDVCDVDKDFYKNPPVTNSEVGDTLEDHLDNLSLHESQQVEAVLASFVDDVGPISEEPRSVNYTITHVSDELHSEPEQANGVVHQSGDSPSSRDFNSPSHADTFENPGEGPPTSEAAEVVVMTETVAQDNSPQNLTPGGIKDVERQHATIGLRNISPGESLLGNVAPVWVPDSVASHCMNCGLKFTLLKRRHHCRACGKALCSACCNLKYALPYLYGKEVRVCQVCCNALLRAQAISQVLEENEMSVLEQPQNEVVGHETQVSPEGEVTEQEAGGDTQEGGNNEEDGLVGEEGIQNASLDVTPSDPPEQLHLDDTPITEQVPGGSSQMTLPSAPLSPLRLTTDRQLSVPEPPSPALSDDSDILFRLDVDHVRSLMPEETSALPPVLTVVNGAISIQEEPDPAEIMYQLKGLGQKVVFLLNKNLTVKLKIVKMNCCVKRKCWCFVTEGMGAANQEEMVVILECLHKENTVPKDVLSHFNTAFAYAKQGHTVSDLGFTIFGQPFLGSSDNAGFLYVKPTFQCLQNLPLPSTPYVVGILIRRTETPWAQLFPLRLKLRLGAEFRYYPCPLWSVRSRPSVYGDIGHTIMNLLADFKNFQYTLPRVTGMVIHMEEKRTFVRLPQDRYDEVLKVLNGADEYVMAFEASFSMKADSHLVCIQTEQGYKTQAINIQNQPRQVTGTSFVVFNGALKSSSPYTAKISIVEDGIMVQMNADNLQALRQAMREMHDFSINTGIPGKNPDQQLIVEWVTSQESGTNRSPVDGIPLDGYPCIKVHSSCDFTKQIVFRIQWTDVYLLNGGSSSQHRSKDLSRLTANIAKACCDALLPHLETFWKRDMTQIGLRVKMDQESEGYLIGSQGKLLSPDFMTQLDNKLVPALNTAANTFRGGALSVELLLRVMKLL